MRGVSTTGNTYSDPGALITRNSGLTSLPRPPLHDEHEALTALRELVGELHGDAAAEAVADEGGPLVTEHDHQVANARRVGAEAVVAAGLGRLAVAQ